MRLQIHLCDVSSLGPFFICITLLTLRNYGCPGSKECLFCLLLLCSFNPLHHNFAILSPFHLTWALFCLKVCFFPSYASSSPLMLSPFCLFVSFQLSEVWSILSAKSGYTWGYVANLPGQRQIKVKLEAAAGVQVIELGLESETTSSHCTSLDCLTSQVVWGGQGWISWQDNTVEPVRLSEKSMGTKGESLIRKSEMGAESSTASW